MLLDTTTLAKGLFINYIIQLGGEGERKHYTRDRAKGAEALWRGRGSEFLQNDVKCCSVILLKFTLISLALA